MTTALSNPQKPEFRVSAYPFKGQDTRIILDEQGEPWWIAKDVCQILDIQTRHVRDVLEDDEVREIAANVLIVDIDQSLVEKSLFVRYMVEHGARQLIPEAGRGGKPLLFINEPGLYRLILKSRKPEAKEFQRWVTHDVLPSIRKTGSYSVNPMSEIDMIIASATALKALRSDVEQVKTRMAGIEQTQQHIEAVLVPIPEVSTRMKLNEIVREYCIKTGSEFNNTWRQLYREFRNRTGKDLVNRQKLAGETSCLDVAERLGLIDQLFSLAVKLFVAEAAAR